MPASLILIKINVVNRKLLTVLCLCLITYETLPVVLLAVALSARLVEFGAVWGPNREPVPLIDGYSLLRARYFDTGILCMLFSLPTSIPLG